MRRLPRIPLLTGRNCGAHEFGPDLAVSLVEGHLCLDASEAVPPDDRLADMEAIAVLNRR